MRQAGVCHRIGTSRRWYHWLTCNQRVNLSRKKSHLHEAQINVELLAPFHIAMHRDLDYLQQCMGFKPVGSLPEHLSTLLKPQLFNLIIHPFTNGHTREWPVSHFVMFINQLPRDQFNIIVTGSQAEREKIQTHIVAMCPDIINVAGQSSLSELMQLIARADGLVANATGPMHLAAALGIHTLGLFPATRGIDPQRWKPLGALAQYLMADPACRTPQCLAQKDCLCMESIAVSQVKDVVMQWGSHSTDP
jgi:ADP-heptose:LPS heptosyltransferase